MPPSWDLERRSTHKNSSLYALHRKKIGLNVAVLNQWIQKSLCVKNSLLLMSVQPSIVSWSYASQSQLPLRQSHETLLKMRHSVVKNVFRI